MDGLAVEIAEIYESISKPLTRTPPGLMDELDYRCQWLTRSAEIRADAQHIYDKRRGEVAETLTGLNATSLRLILDGKTADERKLLDLADRLNATITHQIDAIRSILSFEKSIARV